MTFAFLKKKSVWIPLVLVLIVGGLMWRNHVVNAGPFYDTQVAQKRTLIQTVEVTGDTKPESRIDLSFKTSGKLNTLSAIVGQKVKAGDVLATLDPQDATFAMRRAGATVAQAQASLAARQAQDSPQAIQIAQAQRDQAQANLDKAKSDLELLKITSAQQVALAQIAYDTAQQNLTNAGNGADLTVQASLSSLRTSLISAANTLSSALTEADTILGVENTGANSAYVSVLGIYDHNGLTKTQGEYLTSRTAQRRADGLVRVLNTNSSATDILAAGQATVDALQQSQWFLDDVQNVLTNSGVNGSFTSADLAAKRASMQTWRTSVATQYGSLSASVQALQASTNQQTTTRAQLQNALRTAQANLTIATSNQISQTKNAQTTVDVDQAALSSAEASLSQHKSPARAVDLQVLRAQIEDAQIAYEQAQQRVKDTQLVAPADGVIAEVVPTVGEQVVQDQKVMGLVVTSGYTIEASIPEADIAKIAVGQSAVVTLDAFGDSVKFSAHVLSIEPDRIKSQDAVFYNVSLALDPTDRDIKPGLTANVTITTGQVADAIVIPLRAVKSDNDVRSVQILTGKTIRVATVELGLRGDDGQVEVKTGLNQGDQVIIGELTASEYAKVQADAKAAAAKK